MSEHVVNMGLPHAVQRTKLSAAVLAKLEEEKRPVITSYGLFLLLRHMFKPESRRTLHLRSDMPTQDDLRKVTVNLLNTGGIAVDPDYGRSVFKVLPAGDGPADEVCALANPFGYISHLSALQRWGLTDRRPEALHLTMPPASAARPLLEQQMAADDRALSTQMPPSHAAKLHFIRHPDIVRGRGISVYETKHPGQWLQVRDSHARLATIGQTFVDSIDRPQYCGGMAHVIDIWRRHAGIYRQEIIMAAETGGSPIVKVRAGYLLDEMLGLGDDLRIQGWMAFAQRGGARVLDPAKDFNAAHSKKWMLSINA